jgi:hypothetical protein
MDLTAPCPIRRNLEESHRILVSRLSSMSSLLSGLAGVDHNVFNATSAECFRIKDEIAAAHRLLSKHREQHGC